MKSSHSKLFFDTSLENVFAYQSHLHCAHAYWQRKTDAVNPELLKKPADAFSYVDWLFAVYEKS